MINCRKMTIEERESYYAGVRKVMPYASIDVCPEWLAESGDIVGLGRTRDKAIKHVKALIREKEPDQPEYW